MSTISFDNDCRNKGWNIDWNKKDRIMSSIMHIIVNLYKITILPLVSYLHISLSSSWSLPSTHHPSVVSWPDFGNYCTAPPAQPCLACNLSSIETGDMMLYYIIVQYYCYTLLYTSSSIILLHLRCPPTVRSDSSCDKININKW